MDYADWNPLRLLGFLFKIGALQAEHVFKSQSVQKLLNSNEKFDAVIVELFAIDSLVGFGQHFDCPVLGVNTFDGVYWNDVFTANQPPSSYIPMVFLGLPDRMTYVERLKNTIYTQLEMFAYHFVNLRSQRKLYEKYFPNTNKSFDEVHKNLSVLFMNSHTSTSSARPLMPNMIEINGIHVQDAKPLPDDIQSFLDSATDGAILFSMGSTVRSIDWTAEQRGAFVRSFAKLKMKVLWKYENETLPEQPDNVMIGSWIPQRDILAHPNLKLFLTHGGNLGTTEAMSEGVPLLGIPLFGDQMVNMKRAVAKGYALTLDIKNITEETVSKALDELLNNPKYYVQAKRISRVFKDRPLSPKQTVVYWTEYAIRQNGADHLKAAGRHLNYVEYHLIDVYATIFVGSLGLLFVIYKIIEPIFKKSRLHKKKLQ